VYNEICGASQVARDVHLIQNASLLTHRQRGEFFFIISTSLTAALQLKLTVKAFCLFHSGPVAFRKQF
jgi:hypothetical protein